MNKTHIGLRPKWLAFQIGSLPNWLKEPAKRIGCSQEQSSERFEEALSAYCLQINNERREDRVIGVEDWTLVSTMGLTAFRGAPRLVHGPGAARMEVASPLQGLELLVSVSWVCGRQVP